MRSFLLLLLLFPILCFTQSTDEQIKIDSLKQVIKTAVNDTTVIKSWIAWDELIYLSDPELDLELNNKIINRCHKILDDKALFLLEKEKKFYQKALAEALKTISIIYKDQGDVIKEIEYLTLSLKLNEDIDNKSGIASSLGSIGNIYEDQGDYANAIKHYTRSLKISEDIDDKSEIGTSLSNIGSIYLDQGNYIKALEYYTRCLKIDEEIDDKSGIAISFNNIGLVYFNQGDNTNALKFYTQSLEINKKLGHDTDVASTLSNIGSIYEDQENYIKALEYYTRCLKIDEELENKSGIAISLNKIGDIYHLQNEYTRAIQYSKKSLKLAKEVGKLSSIESATQSLYESYKKLGNNRLALQMYETYISINDSLEILANQKEFIRQEYKYAYEKLALADSIQHVQEQRVIEVKLAGQKQRSSFLIAGLILALLFGAFIFNRFRVTRKQKKIIESQKKLVEIERDKSDHLLLNILPKDTAAELKEKGSVSAQSFPMTSILFTDFKGFTAISEKMSPEELLKELNYCFSEFDIIMQRNSVEKIKTIGDAYMAASGVPTRNGNHAKDILNAALEVKHFMLAYAKKRVEEGKPYFEIRIGVHSGPLVAGVVGIQKFQYDVWGDTVNVASRMESNSEAGMVNISESTYQLVKKESAYTFTSRGEISVKGKGDLTMYFVDS